MGRKKFLPTPIFIPTGLKTAVGRGCNRLVGSKVVPARRKRWTDAAQEILGKA